MATFGLSPVASAYPPPAAESFPNFIQFQSNGVNLGEADVATVNFVGREVTRGTGESSDTLTVQLDGLTWRTVTGNTTLVQTDGSKGLVTVDASGTQTVTVPADTGDGDLPVGTQITLLQQGAATLAVAAASGVTLLYRTVGFLPQAAAQNAEMLLTKVSGDTWLLSGDLYNTLDIGALATGAALIPAAGWDDVPGMTRMNLVTGATVDVNWQAQALANRIEFLKNSAERVHINMLDRLTAAERLDVLNRAHGIDIGAKIQAASDELYARGGGVLYFPSGDYNHAQKLWVRQNVVWEGDSFGIVNQYVNTHARPTGSVLFKLAGSNNDGVEIRCDLTLTGGVLYDTGKTTRNGDARHCGGIRRMTIWGNRSQTAAPESVDLNNAGNGLIMSAARYVVLEDVLTAFWAVDGWVVGVYNYGLGDVGVNNLSARNMVSLSNGRDGMNLSLGDSRVDSPYDGYNGRNGITATLGNSQIVGGSSWNNRYRGVYLGPNPASGIAQILGHLSYDNDGPGFVQDGSPRVAALVGCLSRGNGRNSLGAWSSVADLSNYVVSAACRDWALLACRANPYDQDGVLKSAYNYYLNNANNPGRWEACDSDADGVSGDVYLAAAGNLNRPLVGMTNFIMVDAEDARSSISGTNLAVGYVSDIVFTSATPITINTMSFAGKGRPKISIRNIGTGTVTVVHSTASIRINSGSNLVIGQYQCYRFKSSNSANTVWQQEG